MPRIKLAVQLSALRLPFRKALAAAARLGVHNVEIDARGELRPQELGQTGLREVRRLLEQHELRAVAVGFRTRRGYDETQQLDKRLAATKSAMKFAAELGATHVINQVGRVPEEPAGASWNQLVQALADLGRYGQHVGATLAAQSGSSSGPALAGLLDAVAEHGIGADFDPGNLIIHGFSPLEAVQALGGRIVQVHARDAARDLARGRGLEVPLGRGTADFPALLGALEAAGYRGYFTIGRDDAEDPLRELAEAIQYLTAVAG